ncbi:hypothetical protein PILCRDRAFT_10300 [Piloderma croceum F 1598]|uniref:Uncharacterized protein n=1 Tax=Piloderma croceum (strain F 1598) TaxID=765440 RepID=A0A0C3AZP0_PILCF|nr:hypothetical protein PILCRDRAFT_10300 [Piloderma croceum F 1598]
MDSPILEQHRLERNKYGEEIRKARNDHWEEWVESTEAMRLYVINKFVTATPTDGGSMRVPTLKLKQANGSEVEIANNEGKSKALYDVFFYSPPMEIDIDLNYAYPPPKEQFRKLTDEQIHCAIKKLKPYSAPGPNGALYRATFWLKHYPKRWQEYITIVLRKPGKLDYSNPKAH